MALPNTNITTTLVGQTLGTSSRDVGTLCTHPNINKWSKWKPVRSNKTAGLTVEDLTTLNFGLNISVYTSIGTITTTDTFLYDLKNSITNWAYLRPRGSNYNEGFRLGDFRNYNHEAVQPIGALSSYDVYLNTEGGIQIDLDEIVSYPNNYNITLQDFVYNGTPVTDCYLGLLLYKADNTYVLATSENTIGSNDLTIVLEEMAAYTGIWKAAFFLSSIIIEVNGNIGTGFFIPLDMPHSDVIINAAGTLYGVEPVGTWNQANTIVNYELYVSNGGSTSANINNIQSFLIYTTGSQLPENGTILAQNNHGNLTVAGQATTVLSSLSFTHTRVAGRIYWLAGQATGVATTYIQVEESVDM